jgi:hypothetical protein
MIRYAYSEMTERDAHIKNCHAQWSEYHARRRAIEEQRAKREAWHTLLQKRRDIKARYQAERLLARGESQRRELEELAALETPK